MGQKGYEAAGAGCMNIVPHEALVLTVMIRDTILNGSLSQLQLDDTFGSRLRKVTRCQSEERMQCMTLAPVSTRKCFQRCCVRVGKN